jgi:hypothetical protein
MQAIEMSNELRRCAESGDLERVQQLVEGGANIEETNEEGRTALILASLYNKFEIVVYLVDHGANVAHTDGKGKTALHMACLGGNFSSVKCLLKHGARIADRDDRGMTAFLWAAYNGRLEVVQYLLSLEGGASITESDGEGSTALLLAARGQCHPPMIQWLLEYGSAKITDTNNAGTSVWTGNRLYSLPSLLRSAYEKNDDGEYVFIDAEYVPTREVVSDGEIGALTAMLRVMVLHGGPPPSLTEDLAPPFQRIVQDGARLRARLPAYLAQRRALLDAHCPLLPPLRDLVHGYEEPTTTDELWATGLGARLQRARRSRPERGQSPERRSARLRQKRQ